jgi:probable rRNA maturation factor
MQQYNKRYRGKDRPTDVLSFEASAEMKRDDPGYLGDLLLCVEYAAHEAHRRGISLEEELARLVIHGVLHLVGYDHATVREELVMFGLQEACLDRVLLCVNHS